MIFCVSRKQNDSCKDRNEELLSLTGAHVSVELGVTFINKSNVSNGSSKNYRERNRQWQTNEKDVMFLGNLPIF